MSIKEIKQRLADIPEADRDYYNWECAAIDIAFLLEQNQRLVEALEQFTRGKFHRSIVADTWGPMVHIENEPWKIAEDALQAYKLLEKKD